MECSRAYGVEVGVSMVGKGEAGMKGVCGCGLLGKRGDVEERLDGHLTRSKWGWGVLLLHGVVFGL